MSYNVETVEKELEELISVSEDKLYAPSRDVYELIKQQLITEIALAKIALIILKGVKDD